MLFTLESRWNSAWTRPAQVLTCVLVAWAGLHQGTADQGDRSVFSQFSDGALRTVQAPLQAALPATAEAVDLAELNLGLSTIQVIVQRNDTLDRIFRRLQISVADLANLRSLAGLKSMLDRLKPGEALTLTHRDDKLFGLKRELSPSSTLNVMRSDTGFKAHVEENPLEIERRTTHGVIGSSLFEAAASAGLRDQTALALADLFGWDIDFVLDIQQGDSFSVTYEQLSQDGEYVGDGAILAASFVNRGREYRAVRYTAADGKTSYYTADGRSLRKAFLRAPVEFSRISSGFNLARRHPILNTIRAHKGVDYAAPTGTPVRAAGDGRVRFRGVRGGYGNVVELEHANGVTTVYGHLSRFANEGVNSRVSQGEVIGYVGKTGLATGPHLHYEYRVRGVFKNPQTVSFPDAQPIEAALKADFQAQAAPLLAGLRLQQRGPSARYVVAR